MATAAAGRREAMNSTHEETELLRELRRLCHVKPWRWNEDDERER
jgi:hypothetical protein